MCIQHLMHSFVLFQIAAVATISSTFYCSRSTISVWQPDVGAANPPRFSGAVATMQNGTEPNLWNIRRMVCKFLLSSLSVFNLDSEILLLHPRRRSFHIKSCMNLDINGLRTIKHNISFHPCSSVRNSSVIYLFLIFVCSPMLLWNKYTPREHIQREGTHFPTCVSNQNQSSSHLTYSFHTIISFAVSLEGPVALEMFPSFPYIFFHVLFFFFICKIFQHL